MENKIKVLFKRFYEIILVFIWTAMFYLLGWACGWFIGKKNHPVTDFNIPEHTVIDSIKPKLDSIEYNIIKKDSVIYNIKEEMKNEIGQSEQLTDTATVNEFYKLVSEH